MSVALGTIGVEVADAAGVCGLELHRQLLLPSTPTLMLLTVHDRLGIEKSSTWEDVAEQFDMTDDVSVHEPGMLENGSSKQNLELNDLERMLALESVCVVEMSLEEKTALLSGV
jgi:hypothetical protein